MESITKGSDRLEGLHGRIKRQAAVVGELVEALAGREAELRCRDEAANIRRLKARVLSEVEEIRTMEATAARGHGAVSAIAGLGSLAIGSVVSAASGRRRPQQIGASVASRMLDRRMPFGSVMVVVGQEWIPEEVKAVSISRLARESGSSESAVMAGLRASGNRLMTLDVLEKVLDKRERELLNGSTAV